MAMRAYVSCMALDAYAHIASPHYWIVSVHGRSLRHSTISTTPDRHRSGWLRLCRVGGNTEVVDGVRVVARPRLMECMA